MINVPTSSRRVFHGKLITPKKNNNDEFISKSSKIENQEKLQIINNSIATSDATQEYIKCEYYTQQEKREKINCITKSNQRIQINRNLSTNKQK